MKISLSSELMIMSLPLSVFVVENYLRLAKDRYGYTPDQSLGMLYYHSYDITKAVTDLANFCPLKGFVLVASNYE